MRKRVKKLLHNDEKCVTIKALYVNLLLGGIRIMATFYASKWITLLMKIRNAIMKPFGLKRGKDLSDLVHIETENLATISKNDKHLDLEIAFMTGRVECDSQRISVSTKVRFHNRFGKCYFAIIKPFHNLICKTLLLRAKNNIEKSVCR